MFYQGLIFVVMAAECIEAIIDEPLLDFEVGEEIGECGGFVKGFDRNGVVVEVFPTPIKCQRCPYGEDSCTQSRAD